MKNRKSDREQQSNPMDSHYPAPPYPKVGTSYADALFASNRRGPMRQTLQKAAEVVRRQKWVMLAVFLAVLVAVAFYTLRQTPLYQAESLLLVSEERFFDPTDALSYGQFASVESRNMAVQLVILEYSIAVAEQTAQRLLENPVVPETGRPLSILAADSAWTVPLLARYLQERIVQVEQEKENVVSVVVTGTDANEVTHIANIYAEEALRRSQEASRRRVTASRQFLEEQMAEGRMALAQAEAQLQNYMQDEHAVALDQEVQEAVGTVARFEAALAEAQVELEMRQTALRSTEAELRRIKPMLTQRVASSIDREVELAQEKLAELEVRREEIYQNFPDLRNADREDSRIKAIEDQIVNWQQHITQLSDRYVEEIITAGGNSPNSAQSGVAYVAGLERQLVNDRIAVQGLEAKIAALQQQLGTHNQELSHIPRKSIQLAQLERERASSEQLYTYLEQRLHEAMIAEEAEIGSLRLLRSAVVPTAPVFPRSEMNIMLGALLALLVSIGAGALRSRLDGRLFTPDEVRRQGVHLLSVIPDMRPFVRKAFRRQQTVTINGRKVSVHMAPLVMPQSAVAEAYRHLYTRMQFGLPDRVVQSVVVTSAEAGAGKSTTALNLALTTARAHRRTLIIDADMRLPTVHRYLDLDSGCSLQDLVAAATSAESLERALFRFDTGIENLYAVTVREPATNPLEQLAGQEWDALMQVLTHVFDIVIFDTPPLLLAAEAALLSPLCDATVVVVSAGQTQAEALQRVEEELREANAPIMGIVLNRFDPASPTSRHTYGYRQRHYGEYYRQNAV